MTGLAVKIKHGLLWRWKKHGPWRLKMYGVAIHDLLYSKWFMSRINQRWKSRSDKPLHNLPAKLVVSVTSFPPRFGSLHLTLKSILLQSIKADHTVLWIAHDDIPKLPKEVTDLRAAGLEIRATGDLKSYKKIIPALDAFPDAFICTADDDLYYWPNWLAELIENVQPNDRIVRCHRAHEIRFDASNKIKPYAEWGFNTPKRGMYDNLFPGSGGGTLYPPGILKHTIEDRQIITTLCPRADDVWLYWMARRNGARIKTVGRSRELIQWTGSQASALWRHNIVSGGNDEQIANMIAQYGFPSN